ncbi:glycosyltransferase family 2 protein [Pontibacter populi]|uniref:Glycosyltransferase family 2 protein n=1 Tax=Pontibacter populi TaxID=890055 RepID=A0ABV1RW68_9BACT
MRISIISINYNNTEGLEQTIKSVLAQTYDNIEYIVVDGGSTDGSIDIINRHSDFISYWVSEKDRGVYNAMNKGIEQAHGDYLMFLNSGDTFYNNQVLEHVNKYFSLKNEIIYGDLNVVRNGCEEFINYPDQLSFRHLFNGNICHQAIFYQKDLFKKVGIYLEDYTITADWVHLVTAIFKYNCSYIHIPVIISTYPLNGISEDPNNLETLITERERFLNSEFSLFTDDYKELERLNMENKKLEKSNALLKNSKLYKANYKLRSLFNKFIK